MPAHLESWSQRARRFRMVWGEQISFQLFPAGWRYYLKILGCIITVSSDVWPVQIQSSNIESIIIASCIHIFLLDEYRHLHLRDIVSQCHMLVKEQTVHCCIQFATGSMEFVYGRSAKRWDMGYDMFFIFWYGIKMVCFFKNTHRLMYVIGGRLSWCMSRKSHIVTCFFSSRGATYPNHPKPRLGDVGWMISNQAHWLVGRILR